MDPLTLPELVAKRDAFLRDGLLPAANAEGAVALDEASSRVRARAPLRLLLAVDCLRCLVPAVLEAWSLA